jgi:hypothetical protein
MESSNSRFKFIDLAEDVFRELGLQPPSRESDQALPLVLAVDVDQESFQLEHSEHHGLDRLVLECRFGTVPPERAVRALTRLLQINNDLRADVGAAFAADAQTDEVVYMRSVSLEHTKARDLLDHMSEIKALAQAWRETWFDEPELIALTSAHRAATSGT